MTEGSDWLTPTPLPLQDADDSTGGGSMLLDTFDVAMTLKAGMCRAPSAVTLITTAGPVLPVLPADTAAIHLPIQGMRTVHGGSCTLDCRSLNTGLGGLKIDL